MGKLSKKLLDAYERVKNEPSDIYKHVPRLRELASHCDHVTEFGTREGISTVALLAGIPDTLISYDHRPLPRQIREVADLAESCGVHFEHVAESTLTTKPIDSTNLLFIDTLHTFDQLRIELERHSRSVSKWIVIHDTKTFGHTDQGRKNGPGLMKAIDQFVSKGDFHIKEQYWDNHGLTVLERIK